MNAVGKKYGAIYADPPWRFEVWSGETAVKARKNGGHGTNVAAGHHYQTMTPEEIAALPVPVAANDCALFLWVTWPTMVEAIDLMRTWGFKYKTCAFCWVKANAHQADMFREGLPAKMGMGYWTRANSEVCLLATKGKPKRLHADVRQAIIEPAREHSRKPDEIRKRIERLVAGPYLEMFARQTAPGWDAWGNEVGKFGAVAA